MYADDILKENLEKYLEVKQHSYIFSLKIYVLSFSIVVRPYCIISINIQLYNIINLKVVNHEQMITNILLKTG